MRRFLLLLALSAAPLIGCGEGAVRDSGRKVSGGNYHKVKTGMSQSDVTAILGEPAHKLVGVAPGPSVWHWRDGAKEISVLIGVDGRVDGKSQQGLD